MEPPFPHALAARRSDPWDFSPGSVGSAWAARCPPRSGDRPSGLAGTPYRCAGIAIPHPSSLISASACSSQNRMSRYIVGRAEARLRGLVERCRTLAAEFVLRRVTCAARGADGSKRRGALAAESRSEGILGFAPGALHAGASKPPRPGRSERWAESNRPGRAWSRTPPRVAASPRVPSVARLLSRLIHTFHGRAGAGEGRTSRSSMARSRTSFAGRRAADRGAPREDGDVPEPHDGPSDVPRDGRGVRVHHADVARPRGRPRRLP